MYSANAGDGINSIILHHMVEARSCMLYESMTGSLYWAVCIVVCICAHLSEDPRIIIMLGEVVSLW